MCNNVFSSTRNRALSVHFDFDTVMMLFPLNFFGSAVFHVFYLFITSLCIIERNLQPFPLSTPLSVLKIVRLFTGHGYLWAKLVLQDKNKRIWTSVYTLTLEHAAKIHPGSTTARESSKPAQFLPWRCETTVLNLRSWVRKWWKTPRAIRTHRWARCRCRQLR